jgi:hypothetical protein
LSFATEARNKNIIEELFKRGVDKYKAFGEDSKHQEDSFTLLLKSCKNYDDLNLVKYFLDNGRFINSGGKNSRIFEDKYITAAREIDKAADAIKGDDIAKKELRAIYKHVKELIEVAIAKEKRDARERMKKAYIDVKHIPIKENAADNSEVKSSDKVEEPETTIVS